MTMDVIESARTVPSDFIKTMLNILDEEMGQTFGFPVSPVKENGSELATSRTILEPFNTTYAGVRQKIFTFEDIQCKFILDVANVKDQLKIAQANSTSQEHPERFQNSCDQRVHLREHIKPGTCYYRRDNQHVRRDQIRKTGCRRFPIFCILWSVWIQRLRPTKLQLTQV